MVLTLPQAQVTTSAPLPSDASPSTSSGGLFSDISNGLNTFFSAANQGINLYSNYNKATAQGTLEQGTANTLSTTNNAAGATYQMGQALSSPFVWVLLAIALVIFFLR